MSVLYSSCARLVGLNASCWLWLVGWLVGWLAGWLVGGSVVGDGDLSPHSSPLIRPCMLFLVWAPTTSPAVQFSSVRVEFASGVLGAAVGGCGCLLG